MSNSNLKNTIDALVALQQVDTQLDYIEHQKGLLPKNIAKVKEKIARLQADKEKANAKKEEITQAIAKERETIKSTDVLIDDYTEKLKQTKNDEEYQNTSEELEVQKIEIKLRKRKILEHKQHITQQDEAMEEIDTRLAEEEKILKNHEQALQLIEEKTAAQEKNLLEERPKRVSAVPDSFYEVYLRIRNIEKDAVVNVIDDACSGCFLMVPQQQQVHIRIQERLQHCGQCGRILWQVITPEPQETKRRTRRVASRRPAAA